MSRTLRYLTTMLLLLACSGKEKPLTPDTSDGNGQQEKPLLSDDKFGADINPTGNPIGGGEGYTPFFTPPNTWLQTAWNCSTPSSSLAPTR